MISERLASSVDNLNIFETTYVFKADDICLHRRESNRSVSAYFTTYVTFFIIKKKKE